MRFVYEYRTSDNALKRGTIAAPTRDAVYAALKERGIRPSKVEEAPGFFNKLFGKGKRWLVISVLCASCLVLWYSLRNTRSTLDDARSTLNEARLFEDRAQLYGDPVVIRECEDAAWTNAFTVAFDVYLAQYAIPGRAVEPFVVAPPSAEEATRLVEIDEKELAEVAQMKRMVNGMKRELAVYVQSGGTVGGYLKRLEIRQKAERGIFEAAQRVIHRTKDYAVWKEKNAELRAMGLPMVGFPDED